MLKGSTTHHPALKVIKTLLRSPITISFQEKTTLMKNEEHKSNNKREKGEEEQVDL